MRMVVDSLDLVDLGEQLRIRRLGTAQQGSDQQQQRANRSPRHVPSFYSAPSYRRLVPAYCKYQTEDGRTSPGVPGTRGFRVLGREGYNPAVLLQVGHLRIFPLLATLLYRLS